MRAVVAALLPRTLALRGGACGAVAPRPSRGRRTIRSYGIGARPRRARTPLRVRTLRRPRTANPENPQRSPAGSAPAPLIQPPLRHGPPIPGGGRGGRAPRRLGAPPTARFALQGPRPSAVAGSLEAGSAPARVAPDPPDGRALSRRLLRAPPADGFATLRLMRTLFPPPPGSGRGGRGEKGWNGRRIGGGA